MSYKTTSTYKGWQLVQTGHNYYHAIKGSIRVAVGAIRRGDREELSERFKQIVDEIFGGERGDAGYGSTGR